jgi:hypothetical protein
MPALCPPQQQQQPNPTTKKHRLWIPQRSADGFSQPDASGLRPFISASIELRTLATRLARSRTTD